MRKKVHYYLVLFILLLIFSYLSIYKIIENYVLEFSIARYKLVHLTTSKNNDTKVILFWNNFFVTEYWQMPNETNQNEFLKLINCPVSNCVLTHKKNFLSEPHFYDAIVFHGAETWFLVDLPELRSSHQFYVLASME